MFLILFKQIARLIVITAVNEVTLNDIKPKTLRETKLVLFI